MGHSVNLFVYDEPAGLPAGVTLKDASLYVPAERIFRHRNGSLAVFADMFRYELLADGPGLWIDTDFLCVRPVEKQGDHLFGLESPGRINNAILKLPGDSPVLESLRSVFHAGWVPPWHGWRKAMWHAVLHRLDRNHGVARMSWGASGPRALTYFAEQYDVARLARPAEVFYPVSPRNALSMARADFDVFRFVSQPTQCIHLWGDIIGKLPEGVIEPGSFLACVMDGTWRAKLAGRIRQTSGPS